MKLPREIHIDVHSPDDLRDLEAPQPAPDRTYTGPSLEFRHPAEPAALSGQLVVPTMLLVVVGVCALALTPMLISGEQIADTDGRSRMPGPVHSSRPGRSNGLPPADSKGVSPDVEGRRQTINGGSEYLTVSRLSKPGVYTVLLFSTPGCVPCEQVWQESVPAALSRVPNAVAAKVMVRDAPEHLEIIHDLNLTGAFPVVCLVSPVGVVLDSAAGAQKSDELLRDFAESRQVKRPLPIAGDRNIWSAANRQ